MSIAWTSSTWSASWIGTEPVSSGLWPRRADLVGGSPIEPSEAWSRAGNASG
jgi:hypothetical protein